MTYLFHSKADSPTLRRTWIGTVGKSCLGSAPTVWIALFLVPVLQEAYFEHASREIINIDQETQFADDKWT